METNNSLTQRVLPHNIEAEKYLLASILIDSDSLDKLLAVSYQLSGSDFYDTRHKHIYDTIEELNKKNLPIEIISLTEALNNNKLLEKAGGIEYVNSLPDVLPTSANIEYYGQIVKSKSMLRRLINICNDTVAQSLDSSTNVENLIDETEKKIFDINEEKHSASITHIKNHLSSVIEQIAKTKTNHGDISGVTSGYYKLDELTDGFHPSELVVVAARPSMGKTSLVLNMATKMSLKNNIKVGIFSCEMSKTSLVKRMLCSEASIDMQRMRKNMLTKIEEERLIDTAGKLYETNIIFDDTPNIQILELRSKARRMVKDFSVEILLIDYLQLITVDDSLKKSPRHEQIAYVSRSLKGLARQLNLPVIALAQLNRDIEARGEESRPRLSDLKDSGSIEQDADVVMFIHRTKTSKAYQDDDQISPTEPREIIVGKNRSGPTGIVNMIFHKSYTRFELLKKDA